MMIPGASAQVLLDDLLQVCPQWSDGGGMITN
jgi:hypothetical protein